VNKVANLFGPMWLQRTRASACTAKVVMIGASGLLELATTSE